MKLTRRQRYILCYILTIALKHLEPASIKNHKSAEIGIILTEEEIEDLEIIIQQLK